MKYEINRNTLMILPIDNNQSKVIEVEDEYIIDETPFSIMENSCLYFGSSFSGRVSGTKNMLGSIYKAPIVIEESKSIIFFPTSSFSSYDNIWISLNNLINYSKTNAKTLIKFKNDKEFLIDVPYFSIDNQVLRSSMIESILRKRKESKKND